MNDIIVYDNYEIVEDNPTSKNVGDYSLMSDNVNDIELINMWANKPRKSQSQNTIQQYKRQGLSFLSEVGKPLQAVGLNDLLAWQQGLTGSINTQRLKTNAVKSLFSFAQKVGYIKVNPGIMLDAPNAEETKHKKVISESDIVRIINHPDLSERDRTIIHIMYSTGCRVSELCSMKWVDLIEVNDKAVIVIRGKGGKTRESGISVEAYKRLQQLPKEGEYIFLSNRKQQMDRTTINHLFKKISSFVGKEVTPHFTRHSHVTHALQRKANPVDVKEQVGHSSLAVTSTYAHSDKHSSDSLII